MSSANTARKPASPFVQLPSSVGPGPSSAPDLSVVPGARPEVNGAQAGPRNAAQIDMRYLVRALIKYNASDLHIKVGRPPLYRIHGKLIPAKMPQMTAPQVEKLLSDVISPRQIAELSQKLQVDLSFRMGELGRFRCNVFYQRGSLSCVIRMIPFTVPKFDDLGIPGVIKELCFRPRGLVLVTGSTGSGKSTSLAAMVQHINENRPVHVLTVEDPIEFMYRDQKATVTQRELGSDTHSFEDALFAGLRQDPDVIMIGELRDPKTIQFALTAAETGHLVLSTLHTKDAISSIERILDVFPGVSRNQVRIQLASTLVAVISQTLLIRADGSGRIPACEVLINSPAVESYLLKDELSRIPEAMATSNNYYQMRTLNQELERLVKASLITQEEALKVSPNPDDLRLRLSGVSAQEGYDQA
ncbi:MAG: type IV pilus twitching motility protein PilT [Bacteriovoracia bacterium]